jgi:hypothetical protein
MLDGPIVRGGVCSYKPLCGVVRPVHSLVRFRGCSADDLGVDRFGAHIHLSQLVKATLVIQKICQEI